MNKKLYTKKDIQKAFEAGVQWKEKYYKLHKVVGSGDPNWTIKEPDFQLFFTKKLNPKIKKCDLCSKEFTGKHYKIYDENHNLQSGLIHCGCDFDEIF
jgi:hypothetical protein